MRPADMPDFTAEHSSWFVPKCTVLSVIVGPDLSWMTKKKKASDLVCLIHLRCARLSVKTNHAMGKNKSNSAELTETGVKRPLKGHLNGMMKSRLIRQKK